jgi:hypothetical protein
MDGCVTTCDSSGISHMLFDAPHDADDGFRLVLLDALRQSRHANFAGPLKCFFFDRILDQVIQILADLFHAVTRVPAMPWAVSTPSKALRSPVFLSA